MANELKAICTALEAMPGIQKATRGWPQADETLPCAVVRELANTPIYYGDTPYATDIEIQVSVYAATDDDKDAAADDVDTCMTGMHYARVSVWDDDGEVNRKKEMRYIKRMAV